MSGKKRIGVRAASPQSRWVPDGGPGPLRTTPDGRDQAADVAGRRAGLEDEIDQKDDVAARDGPVAVDIRGGGARFGVGAGLEDVVDERDQIGGGDGAAPVHVARERHGARGHARAA